MAFTNLYEIIGIYLGEAVTLFLLIVGVLRHSGRSLCGRHVIRHQRM